MRSRTAGFTLLEVLVVLAIAGMTAALVLPRIAASMDQAHAHGEYLKFQAQVLDLRRQSFHEARGLRLVSSGQFSADPNVDPAAVDPPLAEVQLGPGWSYQLSAPMDIDAGGGCSMADVDLIQGGKVRMHLLGQGGSCRFLRPVG